MDSMKSKQQVQIGSVVKSLDFPCSVNCYYVGLVVGISKMDSTFRAKTIKRVWQGEIDKRFPSDFFVAPLPGQHMFENEWVESRVQVLC